MSRGYPIYGLCWICNEKGEEVKICGGYITVLCYHHRNDWHEYASGVETVREYLRAVTKLDFYRLVAQSAAGNITESGWMNSQKEAHDTGRRAFGIAKRWIAREKKKWEDDA